MTLPSSTSSTETNTSTFTHHQRTTRITAMVVDDTSLFRKIMVKTLEGISGVAVTATASNGEDAVRMLLQGTQVDVVFLDVEMPGMNGLETLRQIRKLFPKQVVVMASGHNQSNMKVTIAALESGAYDFISKPQGGNGQESRDLLRKQLVTIVRSLIWKQSQDKVHHRKQVRAVAPLPAAEEAPLGEHPFAFANDTQAGSSPSPESPDLSPAVSTRPAAPTLPTRRAAATAKEALPVASPPLSKATRNASPARTARTASAVATPNKRTATPETVFKAILIGVSTGGPAALMQLIPKLPANIGVPIFIVQHMPPKFTESLARSLNEVSALTVQEGAEGMLAQPNHVYIAPGGSHMALRLGKNRGEVLIQITQDPPVNSCRPAVDVLFKSAKEVYPNNSLSMILTGMGRDGTEGVRALKQGGSTYTLTQSEGSCVVYGMPKATDDAGLADESLSLEQLPKRVCQLLHL